MYKIIFSDIDRTFAISGIISKDNIKDKADYITDSCENNGIAKLIDKVINKEI